MNGNSLNCMVESRLSPRFYSLLAHRVIFVTQPGRGSRMRTCHIPTHQSTLYQATVLYLSRVYECLGMISKRYPQNGAKRDI